MYSDNILVLCHLHVIYDELTDRVSFFLLFVLNKLPSSFHISLILFDLLDLLKLLYNNLLLLS